MQYPPAREENFSEKIHGVTVADPYRWMENADSEETRQWVKEENELTFKTLKNQSYSTIEGELIKNLNVVTFSNPQPVRGKYFYYERQPQEDQDAFYVKSSLNGDPVKLIDPNGMNANNTVSLDFTYASWTGKYVAYGLSEGGTEMATLYVKDVDKRQDLSDAIVNCRHSAIRWLPDDSGFFYTRNPRPNTVPKNEEHMHAKVYFHKLGDDPNRDELIFGKDRPKEDMIGLALSMDGNYLAISVAQDWERNDIYLFNRRDGTTSPIVKGVDAMFTLSFAPDRAMVLTNYKADNYRVLSVPVDQLLTPIENWEEFIAERGYPLEHISITHDKVLAAYLENACSRVLVFDHHGREKGELPLPHHSSLAGIATNREEKEFFYGVTSFTFPKISYRYDPSASTYQEYRRMASPIDPADYAVAQEWFASKDGTRVPMFIIHKKSLEKNGRNPAVLYGYGGFSSSETPDFNRNWIPWLERGGVFAVANIRGGGEFGTQWHKQGIKENKQRSFDDFIAAAEHLIMEGYTDKDHLGALGGSNGGLLVSAVAVQRPELFGAVCARVPLTDMARFPKFGMAVRWIHEYGNPDIAEEFKKIIKWSPYHNIKPDIAYPNFLFTTGIKDTRVDPLHSRKITALLQSLSQDNNVFIFTDMEAGHGSGKPIAKIVETQALILTFFMMYLGMK